MRRFLLIAVLAAVGLLYGLTIATGSTSPLAEYFWWIIALCALLMLVLASVLTRYVLLLMRDKSKGVFGSQIARRLWNTPGTAMWHSALLGSALLVTADYAASRILSPFQIPVGLMTGALGGAYMLWLLHRSK